jgi:hypothetical protein
MAEQSTTGTRPERLERASTYVLIGRVFLVADLLVVFFTPAAFKVGSYAAFVLIIAALGGIGVALLLTGYSMRRKLRGSRPEE